ncbi:MAG: hypothetical protein H5T73_06425 [Actinobacteria bacterium]|nr:hypothetical protein [Actinomycetota bacterium]
MRKRVNAIFPVIFPVIFILFSTVLAGAVAPAADGEEFRASCGSTGWYFAEGYTGGDFDTWITIQNPNQTDATAHLRFFLNDGDPVDMDLPLGKETRTSVLLNSIPALKNKEVATMVTATGDGIIAERAMYFRYEGGGAARAGGHASIGATDTSCYWYLPEGYTGGGFDTWLVLMNPTDTDANDVYVKLLVPWSDQYYMFKTSVPAQRRRTIKIDDLVWKEGTDNLIADVGAATGGGGTGQEVKFDNTEVSTYVFSNGGVGLVVERAMYFDYYGKAGGSCSMGAPSAASTWYLPEGYTGGDFDTWVEVMNPSGDYVDIVYTFYSNKPGFTPVSVTHPGVKPWSRDTIKVDAVPGLEGTDVSTKVQAYKAGTTTPAYVVAERAMYFRYGTASDGHTSIGAAHAYNYWFLAEGYTGGSFDTYVCVMNPMSIPMKVKATFMTPSGHTVKKEYDVPAYYRLTIKVDDQDPSLAATDVSTMIEAETLGGASAEYQAGMIAGVVAERAMYFTYRDPIDGSLKSGGSCSIGYGSY